MGLETRLTSVGVQIGPAWSLLPTERSTVASGWTVYGDLWANVVVAEDNVSQFGQSPIPEPATIIIWSLLGAGSWLGTRVWRQRRGPVGRQAWPEENRIAILSIIRRTASAKIPTTTL